MPIGMSKPLPKRKQRDMAVVRATFRAISAAMGWDKKEPPELWLNVNARMLGESFEVISRHDDALAAVLNPAEE